MIRKFEFVKKILFFFCMYLFWLKYIWGKYIYDISLIWYLVFVIFVIGNYRYEDKIKIDVGI